jgi:hypothetical protein
LIGFLFLAKCKNQSKDFLLMASLGTTVYPFFPTKLLQLRLLPLTHILYLTSSVTRVLEEIYPQKVKIS